MVAVGHKPVTEREARARGEIRIKAEVLRQIEKGTVSKGDVLAAARFAGILAAKSVGDLIPLCHSLSLDFAGVDFKIKKDRIAVTATARTHGKTGVEMEALTAVSVACLTLYDMVKSMDREMTIGPIYLLEKKGGRSGHYFRKSKAERELL